MDGQRNHLALGRMSEPKEGAFTLLVPEGWQIEGGIQRADLMARAIDIQSIEAKVDFSVKRDEGGSAMIRWCPEIKYCDPRYSLGAGIGALTPAGTYQGMPTYPLMSPARFLVDVMFSWAHPQARFAEVLEESDAPELLEDYMRRMSGLGAPGGHEAAKVTLRYHEDGVTFLEHATTIIASLGPLAGGIWSNKETIYWRAPESEFDDLKELVAQIQGSVQINHLWFAQEWVNQEMLRFTYMGAQQAAIWREQRMLEIQGQMQALDREMAEERSRTLFEAQRQSSRALLNQERFHNPYTGWWETGIGTWYYRWVTADGDEFYSNDEWDDPNLTSVLGRGDWKRSAVRSRSG